jgi:putative ABC transport system permease protein
MALGTKPWREVSVFPLVCRVAFRGDPLVTNADRHANPPQWAKRLLRLSVPTRDREAMVGDLDEEFRLVRLPSLGAGGARRWYWRQALRSAVTSRARRRYGAERRPPASPRTGDSPMSQLRQDIRYGVRTLLKTPTFTVLTILTLALAIGVNTAIFSMMNVLFLQSLPITDGDTIAFIYTANPGRGIDRAYLSEADFLDFRRELGSFTELAAVNRGRPFVLSGTEEPTRVVAFEATANTFRLWGVNTVLGRGFNPGEDAVGAEPVVILSHGFWERRFAADPAIIGTTLELDGYPTTVIGIMDPELEFGNLAMADIWTPLRLADSTTDRESHLLWTSGRLVPGTTIEQARQEVNAVWGRLQAENPDTLGSWSAIVFDLKRVLAPDDTWTIFYMLFLTVGFVMLIACSNVATMMLARSTARAKEIALRAALGAGRRRILAQLVTESLLLSAAAGALGLVLARACLMGLAWMAGENSGLTNFMQMLEIDTTVLVFTLALSGAAPLVFGLLPALRASRPDLSDTLKEGTRGNSRTGGLRLRRFLVATQVALALTLMVVAGLTIDNIVQMRTIDLGFDPAELLTLRIDLPEARYEEMARADAFFDEAERRIRALPQVSDVVLVGSRLGVQMPPQRNFLIEGKPEPQPEELPYGVVNPIGAGGLQAMRLPLVAGREFTDADSIDSRPVAVVNTDAAERFWGDENAIGQRLRFLGAEAGEEPRWFEVVGIAEALPTGDPENPTFPEIWLPVDQNRTRGLALMIRTNGDPLLAATAVRKEVWAVDPDQPIGDMRTMDQIVEDFMAGPQTIFSIFILFALFALAMAAAGIYGVMAFAVSQRTQEIGIRMALGAQGGDVARMIARQAMWMIGAGVAVGTLVALAMARVLASALVGTSAVNPVALAGVILTLAAAAGLATMIPTLRALRIDPVDALRAE